MVQLVLITLISQIIIAPALQTTLEPTAISQFHANSAHAPRTSLPLVKTVQIIWISPAHVPTSFKEKLVTKCSLNATTLPCLIPVKTAELASIWQRLLLRLGLLMESTMLKM
jgi:hypothetical protein